MGGGGGSVEVTVMGSEMGRTNVVESRGGGEWEGAVIFEATGLVHTVVVPATNEAAWYRWRSEE